MPRKHTGGKMHSGPPPQVQDPPVHPSASSPHALLHRPQWLGVTCVLMQAPAQQLSLAPQVRPQAPQFARSVSGSRHMPLQQERPVGHGPPVPHRHVPITQLSPVAHAGEQGTSVVQVPPAHVSPMAQMTPQAPQLRTSVSVLMQAPPQQPWPAPQGAPAPQRHAMATHDSPGAHAGLQSGIRHTPSTHA